MLKTLKPKKCSICKETFQPRVSLQRVCSVTCSIAHSKNLRCKAEKKEIIIRREKLKSRSDYVNDLQKIFNKYIRIRDSGKNCIACGKPYSGICHASHYLSVGAHPEKRFNENNVHGGCKKCNVFLHGNLINYRINLILKIGIEEVEKLENYSVCNKLTLEQIQMMISRYCKLIKEMKQK